MMDQQRVMEFVGRVGVDSGAAFAGLSTSIGARLGLYRHMSGAGPLTAEELAERSDVATVYVREWLALQVASEYVEYSSADETYLLPDEHAAVLADENSPVYAIGAFRMLKALYGTEDALVAAFRTGQGVDWGAHGPELFEGVASFFRPGYAASLVQEWLPALDGVVDRLDRGGLVADVGCGFGYSTLLMAQAFPQARFRGFDFHAPSIERARENAAELGLGDRVEFEVASAQDFGGDGYDLVTFFDCLHDLGDPGGAFRRAAQVLAEDGRCLVVEPNASAEPSENINPVGRAYTATSVTLCLPTALAQGGPVALGNHPGEEALRQLASDAGLQRWRLALETVTNRIYDVGR
jgi:ubiquinone/menaquinone biosynthesis C-methylase UbiE